MRFISKVYIIFYMLYPLRRELAGDSGKVLAAGLGDGQLELRGHAASVGSGEGTGSVGGASVGFLVAEDLGVDVSVGYEDHAVVGKETHHRDLAVLLSSGLGSGGDEGSGGLSDESTPHPVSTAH